MLTNFKGNGYGDVSLIAHNYNGVVISQRKDDEFVNLSQMCKVGGKRLDNWVRLKSTKEYLQELSSVMRVRIDDLIIIRQGGIPDLQGTWGHKLVAQELQRWLDKNNRTKQTELGFLYIYLDECNSAYKIGFTKNLKAREKQHKTSNPFLSLVKCYENVDIDFETLIHLNLNDYRIDGTNEWYHKNSKVLLIIDTLANTNNVEVYC